MWKCRAQFHKGDITEEDTQFRVVGGDHSELYTPNSWCVKPRPLVSLQTDIRKPLWFGNVANSAVNLKTWLATLNKKAKSESNNRKLYNDEECYAVKHARKYSKKKSFNLQRGVSIICNCSIDQLIWSEQDLVSRQLKGTNSFCKCGDR